MSDLKERLRDLSEYVAQQPPVEYEQAAAAAMLEAADRIEALEAENERLRRALECLDIAVCGAAIPHAGERAVVQEAIKMARAALKGE